MEFYHFLYNLLSLSLKVGILHLLQAQAPGMILLPHQDSLLVAKIQENLIVGIVGGAHGVGPQMPDQSQIPGHGRKGQSASKLRMILMAAYTLNAQGASV